MDKQNITLSIPKSTLRKIKHIAVEKHISISKLFIDTMENMTKRDRSYDEATKRLFKLLNNSRSLGTNGKIEFLREDLHKRD